MLERLKISHRLTVGFGAILLVLTALAIFNTNTVKSNASDTAEIARVFEQSVICQRGLKDTAIARGHIWAYISTGLSDYSDNAKTFFGKAHTRLKELSDSTVSPDRKAKAIELESKLTDYETKVLHFASLSREKGIESAEAKDAHAIALTAYKAMDTLGTQLATDYTTHATELKNTTLSDVGTDIKVSWILAAVALILGAGIGSAISLSITRPLTGIMHDVDRLGRKETSIKVAGTDRTDEIGPLAQALDRWRLSIIDEAHQQEEERQRTAQQVARAQRLETLTHEFDGQIGTALHTVSSNSAQLNSTAQALSANSQQTSHQAEVVAGTTNEASHSVQTVASAAEELTSSIHEIARQVSESTRISIIASDEANHTNNIVLGLAESSSKIGEVVSLINDIASQTNLLALNATIEAARAGDAGKGFAVVANEVKNLANQTARATDEISAQISTVQQRTEEAVDAIGGIVKRIAEVSEIAAAIASAVEEQSAATGEIARNILAASNSTQIISGTIQDVTHAAAETGASSSEVLASAQNLAEEAENLEKVVKTFLSQVKAI